MEKYLPRLLVAETPSFVNKVSILTGPLSPITPSISHYSLSATKAGIVNVRMEEVNLSSTVLFEKRVSFFGLVGCTRPRTKLRRFGTPKEGMVFFHLIFRLDGTVRVNVK